MPELGRRQPGDVRATRSSPRSRPRRRTRGSVAQEPPRASRSTCSSTVAAAVRPGAGARADARRSPASIDRSRARPGLPHRQHLQHAAGRTRRRRGRQADVRLPRAPGRPAGGLPRRLRGKRAGQRAASRAGQPAHPRRAPRPPAPDARLQDARSRRRRLGRRASRSGFVAVIVILGSDTLFEAVDRASSSTSALHRRRRRDARDRRSRCTSRVAARSRREVSQERRELALSTVPALAALAARLRSSSARPSSPRSSRCDRARSTLPVTLGLRGRGGVAPVATSCSRRSSRGSAAVLLSVRVLRGDRVATAGAAPARFGPVVRGTLRAQPAPALVDARRRHRRRRAGRSRSGSSLAIFAATYDAAKAADARFVGRLRPAHHAERPQRATPSARVRLHAPGAAACRRVTPVVFKLENSVLIGPYDQDREDLAAIDPASFERVGAALGLVLRRTARPRARWRRCEPIRRASSSRRRPADDLVGRDAATASRSCSPAGRSSRRSRRSTCVGLFDALPRLPAGHEPGRQPRPLRAGDRTCDRVDFFLARDADDSRCRPGACGRGAPARAPVAHDPINDRHRPRPRSTRTSRASPRSTSAAWSTSTRSSRCS